MLLLCKYHDPSLFFAMLLFLLYAIVSCVKAAVIEHHTEYKDVMICIPNSTFHIDCNRCRCSPSGMSIDCTDWSCATTSIPHDLLQNLTLSCEPSEVFLHNRLKCLCAESGGHATCSSAQYELAHDLRPTSGSIRTTVETPEQCTPGLVFRSGCETCICGDNSTGSCLGLGCLNVVNGVADAACNFPRDSMEKVCVPFSTFSIDCNQCVCSNDGLSFSCDRYPCLGAEIRDDQMLNITFLCEPDSAFLYNQYECWCSSGGRSALCAASAEDKTLEYRRADKKVFSIAEFPDVCTPGMIFKELCNVCVCGANESAACTKIDCDLGWDEPDQGRIVSVNELWVQKRKKTARFCRKYPASEYCRYMRNY